MLSIARWQSSAAPRQVGKTTTCRLEGTDGFGRFELRYLRDKLKREVDFLVVRDRKPWWLVEVKMNETALSPALRHFQSATRAAHAFQAVIDLPYVDVDCFSGSDPVVVPARTLLSQLL